MSCNRPSSLVERGRRMKAKTDVMEPERRSEAYDVFFDRHPNHNMDSEPQLSPFDEAVFLDKQPNHNTASEPQCSPLDEAVVIDKWSNYIKNAKSMAAKSPRSLLDEAVVIDKALWITSGQDEALLESLEFLMEGDRERGPHGRALRDIIASETVDADVGEHGEMADDEMDMEDFIDWSYTDEAMSTPIVDSHSSIWKATSKPLAGVDGDPSTPTLKMDLLRNMQMMDTPPMKFSMELPYLIENELISNPLQPMPPWRSDLIDFGNPLHYRDEDIVKVLGGLELEQDGKETDREMRWLDPKLTITLPVAALEDTEMMDMGAERVEEEDGYVEFVGHGQQLNNRSDAVVGFGLSDIRPGVILGSHGGLATEKMSESQIEISSVEVDLSRDLALPWTPTTNMIEEETILEDATWDSDPTSPLQFEPESASTPKPFMRKHPPVEYLATQREIIQSTVKFQAAILQKENLERRLARLDKKIGHINGKVERSENVRGMVERIKKWNEKTVRGETDHFMSDGEVRDRVAEMVEMEMEGVERDGDGEVMRPLLESVVCERVVRRAEEENWEAARGSWERRKRNMYGEAVDEVEREVQRRGEVNEMKTYEEWKALYEMSLEDRESESEGSDEDKGLRGEENRGKRWRPGRGMEGGNENGVKRIRAMYGKKVVV